MATKVKDAAPQDATPQDAAGALAPEAPAPAPAPDAPAQDAPASNGEDAPTEDVLAQFKIAPARKVVYSFERDARKANVEALRANAQSPAPVVTRGKHERTGTYVLALVNGDNVQALPLPAIGAAIAYGVVSLQEIVALLGDAQREELIGLVMGA